MSLNREQFAVSQEHGHDALCLALASAPEASNAFDYLLQALDYIAWDYERPEQSLRAARGYARARFKHTLRLRETLPQTKAKSLGLFQIVAINHIVRELVDAFRAASGRSGVGLLSVILSPDEVKHQLETSSASTIAASS